MASDLDSLIEFGFPEYKAKKALKITGNSGLQAALDWLDVNGDNEEAFIEVEAEDSKKKEKTCLMCNECKKKLKSLEQAELHAARTLHDDFVEAVLDESTSDAIEENEQNTSAVIMTEEEKVARLAELRAKVAAKKAARESEAKEAEVLRKASSKELEQVRREMQAKEMKKLAEERRLEKIADKKRREEIKMKIEEDRENKKRQIEAEKAKALGLDATANVGEVCVPIIADAAPIVSSTSSSARIQVKLPSPDPPLKLTIDSPNTFTLKDLKTRIKSECPSVKNVNELMQTFPTRVFSKDEDDLSLNELGLSPSATLILK